jgi:chromosome segregation ATPase
MPSTLDQNVTKIVNDIKTYQARLAKMPSDVKAKDSNYRNCVSMIYEAQKAITDLKGDIKKGAKNAVEDMKKWQANYPKIYARLKPVSDEVDKLKKSLKDLSDDVQELQKRAEKVNKDASRSGTGDLAEVTKTFKEINADLKKLAEGVAKQLSFLTELPKEPNGVFV